MNKHLDRKTMLALLADKAELPADLSQEDEFSYLAFQGLKTWPDLAQLPVALDRLDTLVASRVASLASPRLRRLRLLRWLTLAASVALLFALGWWVMPHSPSADTASLAQLELALAQPMSAIPLSAERGNAPSTRLAASAQLSLARTAYLQADYQAASAHFADYLSIHPNDVVVQLYQGHALLQHSPADAVVVLNNLLEKPDLDWAYLERAHYLLAWALLRAENTSQATIHLHWLVDHSTGLKDQAQFLLEHLSLPAPYPLPAQQN